MSLKGRQGLPQRLEMMVPVLAVDNHTIDVYEDIGQSCEHCGE